MNDATPLVQLSDAVEQIKTAIMQGQHEALKDMNRVQLAVYYAIGKYLSIHSNNEGWGNSAMETISERLHCELPGLRGFSKSNLYEMRKFYEQWLLLDADSPVATEKTTSNTRQQNFPVTIGKSQDADNQIDIFHAITIPNIAEFPVEAFFNVPFTHHTRILAMCKSLSARYYYLQRTAEEHLSVEALKRLINSQAYEHRNDIPNNFVKVIPDSRLARKAVMMFKDSYALDFINTEEIGERDRQDIDERVVEQKIIQNIKQFILTFGHDFAFIDNQYHLEVYGEEFFPDLLFFNRELNAMVVIELKTGDFKPAYLAQLTTYLQILDDKVKKPHENPSVGIVLCKSANKQFVEYVIQKYDSPMGVATYKTANDMPAKFREALPDIEQMRSLLASTD